MIFKRNCVGTTTWESLTTSPRNPHSNSIGGALKSTVRDDEKWPMWWTQKTAFSTLQLCPNNFFYPLSKEMPVVHLPDMTAKLATITADTTCSSFPALPILQIFRNSSTVAFLLSTNRPTQSLHRQAYTPNHKTSVAASDEMYYSCWPGIDLTKVEVRLTNCFMQKQRQQCWKPLK